MIQIEADNFSVGDTVDVFIINSQQKLQPGRSAMEILNQLSGGQLFLTPSEADQYLQQEKESWER